MKYKSILMDQFLSIFEVAPGVRRENTQNLELKRVCNSLFHLIPNSGFKVFFNSLNDQQYSLIHSALSTYFYDYLIHNYFTINYLKNSP
ncbi:hypothetical protein AYO37_01305 [Opitutia bacterium SCGC AG-212-L18]|nr:hypothetical protein AYO37_01305 [Opitutae bacterium SCGC AG-212-L18]